MTICQDIKYAAGVDQPLQIILGENELPWKRNSICRIKQSDISKWCNNEFFALLFQTYSKIHKESLFSRLYSEKFKISLQMNLYGLCHGRCKTITDIWRSHYQQTHPTSDVLALQKLEVYYQVIEMMRGAIYRSDSINDPEDLLGRAFQALGTIYRANRDDEFIDSSLTNFEELRKKLKTIETAVIIRIAKNHCRRGHSIAIWREPAHQRYLVDPGAGKFFYKAGNETEFFDYVIQALKNPWKKMNHLDETYYILIERI